MKTLKARPKEKPEKPMVNGINKQRFLSELNLKLDFDSNLDQLNLGFLQDSLIHWYNQHQRILPWRKNRNAYPIWISEVMLQQTTVQVVAPYFERFIARFPRPETLASAKIEEVYEMWAGLGYYSRARMLHKAAQELFKMETFPQKASELEKVPGFGPYTSRAVASLAFGDQVGVLDGNVIRVLSRLLGFKKEWWKTAPRKELQNFADALGKHKDSHLINQGMMELGATVCTPQKPQCAFCPWNQTCVALKSKMVSELPLKRPKTEKLKFTWTMDIYLKNNKIFLIENNYTPFLKKTWLPPGQLHSIKIKPKVFKFKHSITKYEIFVDLVVKKGSPTKGQLTKTKGQWVSFDDVKKLNPTSIIDKIKANI